MEQTKIQIQSKRIESNWYVSMYRGAGVCEFANNLHFTFLLKIRITFVEEFLIHFHKQLERIVDQTVDGFIPVSL